MGKPCGQHDPTTVNRKGRTCQEIKICEFANIELREMKHESVDPDSDLRLKINEESNNIENNIFI